MAYFFDTYVLIELLKKNPAYQRFLEEPINTSMLNLGELHYYLLKEGVHRDVVDSWYERLKPGCMEVGAEYVKKAMEFRFKNRKRAFSFIDCIGYIMAEENELVFLTGDAGFEDFDNVEFVK